MLLSHHLLSLQPSVPRSEELLLTVIGGGGALRHNGALTLTATSARAGDCLAMAVRDMAVPALAGRSGRRGGWGCSWASGMGARVDVAPCGALCGLGGATRCGFCGWLCSVAMLSARCRSCSTLHWKRGWRRAPVGAHIDTRATVCPRLDGGGRPAVSSLLGAAGAVGAARWCSGTPL